MRKIQILSNNALKIIAAIAMVIDHVGLLFFPKIAIYRIIGRIAFPIFAYMFAEGSYYTRNKLKHFLFLLLATVLTQIGYFIGTQSYYASIFLVFFVSLILIRLFDYVLCYYNQDKKFLCATFIGLLLSSLVGVYFLTYYTDIFSLNYGFFGIIIPFILYIIKRIFNEQFLMIGTLIFLLGLRLILDHSIYMEYAFLSIIPLIFYNGERGKLKLKYFFYFFYPIHLLILYGIFYLMYLK